MERSPASLQSSTRVLLGALLEAAERDGEVRDALRSLHAWLGNQLESGGPVRDKVVHPSDGRRVTTERPLPSEPLADLAVVQRRAAWKARALRFACDRRAGVLAPEDLASEEAELRRELNGIPECYPWMLDGPMPLPPEPTARLAASALEALAAVAGLADELLGEGSAPPTDLLFLMAEAQSSVLVAVRQMGLRGDSDQRDLFAWLKHQTTIHRVYVDRHMRLDDPADPQRAAELLQRVDQARVELGQEAHRKQERQALLKKLRYHIERGEGGALLESDQESIRSVAESWREAGLPSNDRGLGDLLANLRGREDLSDGLRQALEPLMPATPRVDAEPAVERDPVAEVQPLLEGCTIGALQHAADPQDTTALAAALGNVEITDLPVQALDDPAQVEQLLDENDSQLLLLGVRLEKEAYEVLKTRCAETDRLFVRLPSGYDPPAVARQVLRQVGWRLRRPTGN